MRWWNDGVRLIEVAPADSGLSSLATHAELHVPGGAPAAVQAVIDAGLLGDGPVVVLLGRPSLAESAARPDEAALALAGLGDHVRFLSTLRRGERPRRLGHRPGAQPPARPRPPRAGP